MDTLNGLNKQQIKAVTADPGPILILAGPGSGKTRVLTHRAAYLISELKIQPYHMIAVTFTNKAADEMGERITGLLGQFAQGLTLGTFHSTCARFLRMEAEYLPVDHNFVIFDADDQLRVVKQIFKDLKLNDEEKKHSSGTEYRPRNVLSAISAAKNELKFPNEISLDSKTDQVIAQVYVEYQKILLSSNAFDFDDLLLQFAILLRDNDKIREKYARRYHHILVDEFQDTNLAQYTLLKHLASHHRNIFVVGDSDQSIYRWRGADYKNILRFKKDYQDAEIVLLEQNYRSTQNILDAAMAVIDKNTNRTPKNLFTDRGQGAKILINETDNDREQAEQVVKIIWKQLNEKKASPSDFAVMYRTNAQSGVLEEVFLSADLPYKLVGAQQFYGRREVKDIIAYLRLIVNPSDIVSLRRVINTPRRKIGGKTYETLVRISANLAISPGELLLRLGQEGSHDLDSFSPAAGKSLAAFSKKLLKWRKVHETLPPVEIIHQVVEDIDYRDYLENGTREGYERWENIDELMRLALEHQTVGLHSFLERSALVSDQDTVDQSQDKVTLLTLHAAKGLEFKQVMIIGVNNGIIPHQRSFGDPEAMEEERRLFYVGITRAKDQLMLFHSLRRLIYGGIEYLDESPYYSDIPLDIRSDNDQHYTFRTTSERAVPVKQWKDMQMNQRPVVAESQYHPGDKVVHPKWGNGLVLTSEVRDDDEILEIFFKI